MSSPFFFTSLSNFTFVVNIKDAGTINHNVYLLVVVVAVQGLDGLSHDVGTTFHDGGLMLTDEDFTENVYYLIVAGFLPK